MRNPVARTCSSISWADGTEPRLLAVGKPSRAAVLTAMTLDALPGTSRRKLCSGDPKAAPTLNGTGAPECPTKVPASATRPRSS